MSRVLVTGAAGFAGWHVTQRFFAHCWDVIPFDVGDEFPSDPVDVVVSLAATAEPREALRDPAGAYANCTRIMVETLEYAREVGARVLHVSTNEAHPPRGAYGGAKACQEIVCETYQDVPTTVVVTQSLFGERQQPNKLVPTAVRALLNDEPVTLQRNGTAWASRPFLHVRNLADALVHLAEHPADRARVHVGAQTTFSVRSVVGLLALALRREPRVRAVPAGDRPGHELHVAAIGWDLNEPPAYMTTAALQQVALWYRDNPEWLG